MKLYDWARSYLINRLGERELRAIRDIRHKLRRISNLGGAKILRHMNDIIVERPIRIIVETYSLCNSRCVFCPRRKLKASKEVMSLELFERICSEYAALGGGFLGFSPLLADPLLDPLLLERIHLLKNSFPTIYAHLFTNGILLTKFSDDQLIEMLTTLDHIDISIGGLNRVDYKIMFGVDQFDKVNNSLHRLAKIKHTLDLPCRLALHIRTNRKNEAVNSLELRKFKELGYTCNDIIDTFTDWGGLITEKDLPGGAHLGKSDDRKCNISCVIPMIYMMILPNGLVLGCACFDAKKETIMGYLSDSSLQSIWKGNAFSNFRSSFERGELHPLCKTCGCYLNSEDLLSRPGLKNFEPSKDFWHCV